MRTIPVLVVSMVCLLGACGKKEDNSNNGNPGGGGEAVMKPQADLQGATGLFVVDPTKASGTALVETHNKIAALIGAPKIDIKDKKFNFADATGTGTSTGTGTDTTSTDGSGSLQKSDKSGNIQNALSNTVDTSNIGPNQPKPQLPKILTIALSPAPYNEVFLHFERSFRYKTPTTNTQPGSGTDPRTDGSYCQLFRVKGGSIDKLQSSPPSTDNLECLDSNHFIDNWNATRLSIFQFDKSGNVYYPGQIPNSPKMVIYKWDRLTTELTEMINSNICVQDFLVTKSGGIFYTGTSSCNGTGGNNGGFFRYVSGADKGLTEIARNWWNFIFEPVSTDTADKAVFFGPDPTTATTASWNNACLFQFDPAGGDTTAKRTSTVITCGSDIWNWIQMSRKEDKDTFGEGFQNGTEPSTAWKTEYKNRCTSSGQIFAGGGSQISAIKQDSKGQVYVIGNVRKKNAGTLQCGVEVRGPHCKISDEPDITVTNEADCKTALGTWVDDGNCQGHPDKTTAADCFAVPATWQRQNTSYNGVSTSICTADGSISSSNWWSPDNTKSFQTATDSTTNIMKFRLNNMNCQPPDSTGGGDQWTSEYQGLGKVNASTKTLSLLSSTEEQAIRLWVINDVVYYASFNSTSGHYLLRTYNGTEASTMVDNFEAYNVSATADSTSLYVDGLDFSNNTYNFGTVKTTSPYTRTAKTGLTGTLKTVVILPKF